MVNSNDSTNTITAADGTLVPVPQEFICPLTLDIMVEPLLSREGHNYDREAILSWVADNGTSPLTRAPLRPSQLLRNRALETKIGYFLEQNGIANDAVVNKDGNASRFMGYIVPDKETKGPSMASMSLLSTLTAIQATTRPRATPTILQSGGPSGDHLATMTMLSSMATPTSLESESSGPSGDHLAERRRQLADLIDSAMADLDDF
mmetsp:Transcript_19250/g.36398  ORF Transcript_19250/g.36398 Transcript_19250/m.36398 type:complete len:206 (-) Transcript_19250:45-662(-)